ncbi:MAG TPA: uroporphyrinogen-III synthase, partial [Actinomycetota bacterium]|nr:uroporphyrinogen-III synthase [Actinomycetota bacterium]
ARIIELVPYHWDLPDDRGPAERLVSALIEGGAHALVITSAPQLRHMFVLARERGVDEVLRRALGENVFLAAVGTVAAEGLEREGLAADLVAKPPRMGALVRALAHAREKILEKSGTAGAGASARKYR